MISAGKMRRTVTINTIGVTNTKGDWTKAATSQGTRRAMRQPMTHRESFGGADQRFAASDFLYVFRSDPVTRAIDAEYQLVDDGVTYQVSGALPSPEDMDREVWVYVTRKDT